MNFHILEGELLGITGLNNAGKTILARAIAGKVSFTASCILRGEKELADSAAYSGSAQDIFYISQEPQLFDAFTVAQNIFALERHFALSIFSNHQAKERTQQLLHSLDLHLSPTARLSALSRAQKHLVAICRAIAMGAKLLILDGISSQYSRSDFQTLSALLGRLQGVSIIYISHQADPIILKADRIYFLHGNTITGQLYKNDYSPERLSAILSGPVHPLPAAYSGEKPAQSAAPLLRLGPLPGLLPTEPCLQAGGILLIQDQRDGPRQALIRAFLSRRPQTLLINGKRPRSYQQAAEAGLAVLPSIPLSNGLFSNLSEEDNLSFRILKKTSTFGLVNAKVRRYAQEKYKDVLSTEACLGNAAWRAYKLRLCCCHLAHSRVYVLEDPGANMDGTVLRDLFSFLKSLAQEGAAVLIIASQYESYIPLCSRVLDLPSGQYLTLSPA